MIGTLSRRRFLKSATAMTVAQALTPALHAFAGLPTSTAWVAATDGIHCLRSSGADWLQTAFVECALPSALALHTSERLLYVAHGTESFAHLPTGYVSCYRVLQGGALELLHRQGLSLACVRPDAIAVSPKGDMLCVASGTAAILNVLPMDEHGLPSAATAVRKELGWAVPNEEEATSLSLCFTRDAMLIAIRGRSAIRYRCSLEEILLLGETAGYPPIANYPPATLATAMSSKLPGLKDSAPIVWL